MNRRGHELAAYHSWLRRLARRLAYSRARADDLVQDTYVTALRKAPGDAELRPWLRSVMRKLAWGQLRSERRRSQREQGYSLTAPALALPEALLDQDVDRDRLNAALAVLPEPFQSTLVQRFLKGRSCAEIARSENVPAGTIRWRQARGLELLRAELKIGRPQRAVWALPFLGASGPLVVRAWRTLTTPSAGKAIGLWLALAALIVAVRGSPGSHPEQEVDTEVGAAGGLDGEAIALPRERAVAPIDADDADDARPVAAGDAEEPSELVAAQLTAGVPGVARRSRVPLSHALDRSFDGRAADCERDPINGWRCADPPSSAPLAPDALCALVRQHILAGDAIALASPGAQHVVTAAMLANRALARRLGCPVPAAPAPFGPGGRGRAGCVTRTGADGTPCTVCPGEQRVCAPAECQSRMRADGVVCTTCVDRDGETHSDCPDDPPSGCRSEVADSGLLCTRCDGGPPECVPAECSVIDRCLRCVDPKGRVGVDCSADYEVFRSGSHSGNSPLGHLSSCHFLWGIPHVSGTTCHYPGIQTCVIDEGDDWHCLVCQYPNGASLQVCSDASETLPDPFAGRPRDLPAPGTCITELGADGSATCTTCTREDLSATTSCHHPGLESCVLNWMGTEPGCLGSCRRVDGGRVSVCDSTRGPRPAGE